MKGFQHTMALLVGGLLLCTGTKASAQDATPSTQSKNNQDVNTLVTDAVSLFQNGAYEKALEKFQTAYDLIEEPNILFNMARCYQELDDKENAIEYFNRFLFHPDTPEDAKPAARQRLKELQPDTAPAPAAVDTPSDDDTATDNTEPAEDTSNSETNPLEGQTATEPNSSEEAKISRVPEWTLIGTGAAITIAGAAFGGVALAKHSAFEDSHDADEKKDLESSGKAMGLASDISLGVGIVTMATGIILFVARGRHTSEESPTTAFIPAASNNSVELSWQVRF